MTPLVGITTDLIEVNGMLRSAAAVSYVRAVSEAGGTPVLLPPVVEHVPDLVRRLDAFVLIGGKDADAEPFGGTRHPKSDLVHPDRQAFDTALLRALRDERPEAPTLGVCLGMQMMALVGGGTIDQHLPDTLATHGQHAANNRHRVTPVGPLASRYGLSPGEVCSSHHQAVSDPGPLVVVARSPDDVIEGIADPRRRFYLGVQWHPERTEGPLGLNVFRELLSRCGRAG